MQGPEVIWSQKYQMVQIPAEAARRQSCSRPTAKVIQHAGHYYEGRSQTDRLGEPTVTVTDVLKGPSDEIVWVPHLLLKTRALLKFRTGPPSGKTKGK